MTSRAPGLRERNKVGIEHQKMGQLPPTNDSGQLKITESEAT